MAARKKSASRRAAAKTKSKKAKKAKPRPKAKKAAVRRRTKKAAARPKKARPAARAPVRRVPRPTAPLSPALVEIDQRIAIVRDNLRTLMEQAAGTSGSGSEELISDRIASEEAELQRLIQQRDALAQTRADKPGR